MSTRRPRLPPELRGKSSTSISCHFLHGQLIQNNDHCRIHPEFLTDLDRLVISKTPQPWPTINSFSSSPNPRKASEISSSSGSGMEAKKPMKLEKWKICQNYLLFTVVWMSPCQSSLTFPLIVAIACLHLVSYPLPFLPWLIHPRHNNRRRKIRLSVWFRPGTLSVILQGDHSGCVKPPFDNKTKVAF